MVDWIIAAHMLNAIDIILNLSSAPILEGFCSRKSKDKLVKMRRKMSEWIWTWLILTVLPSAACQRLPEVSSEASSRAEALGKGYEFPSQLPCGALAGPEPTPQPHLSYYTNLPGSTSYTHKRKICNTLGLTWSCGAHHVHEYNSHWFLAAKHLGTANTFISNPSKSI